MALSFYSTLKKPEVEIVDSAFQEWNMQERSTREAIFKRKTLDPMSKRLMNESAYIYTSLRYMYYHLKYCPL